MTAKHAVSKLCMCSLLFPVWPVASRNLCCDTPIPTELLGYHKRNDHKVSCSFCNLFAGGKNARENGVDLRKMKSKVEILADGTFVEPDGHLGVGFQQRL